MRVSCLVVTSRRSRDRKRDFQLQMTQMLEASCLFSFKSILLRTSGKCQSILLRTSGKCQSIKRTACMLNFIYIVQSKWYLRLKISVQGPFKTGSSNSCFNVSLIVRAWQSHKTVSTDHNFWRARWAEAEFDIPSHQTAYTETEDFLPWDSPSPRVAQPSSRSDHSTHPWLLRDQGLLLPRSLTSINDWKAGAVPVGVYPRGPLATGSQIPQLE